MARTRIVDTETQLRTWDDVDTTLAEIGELERMVEAIEAKMQQGIDDTKLAADMEGAPHKKRIMELGDRIRRYVDEHMEDLGGKKTKVLTFGSTGYRKSTKVMLPRAATLVAEIIRKLKVSGMTDCVVTQPEKINKDNLKKYPPNDVAAVGANLHTEDVFWYEVDRERLAEK